MWDIDAVPPAVWRVLSEARFAKDRGLKQITVDIGDLQELLVYATMHDRDIEELEREIDELRSENSRLEDDVWDAQEELRAAESQVATRVAEIKEIRALVNGIEL